MLIGDNPLGDKPDWFLENISTKPLEKSITVKGAEIKYYCWGDLNKPGLILLHGYNAHSNWWSHIAPFFTDKYCVVSLDFSGMGNSDNREEYSQEIYSTEIETVVKDMGWNQVICLAHSMGGAIATYSTSMYPYLFSKLILLDSIIILPPEKAEIMKSRRPKSRMDILSDSLESASSRFRLMPPQPCENDYILDHIAKTSYKKIDDGWVLKADPKISNSYQYNDLHEIFMKIKVDIELVYGQLSQILTQDVLDYMIYVGQLSEDKIHRIDGAMHHLFLDKPLEFSELIKKII
jgi:pimeloyl-ACP methyl ester carboxylesterase|tara:strand:+ start:319 stop:1194 length:876 start_codon:yes stop_codon:yes gene_type:complete